MSFISMSEKPFNLEYHSSTNPYSKCSVVGSNSSFKPFGISFSVMQRVKCACWSLFYQDGRCLFFKFSFWSPVACFFSLFRFVVEEDCRLAASSVPSKHYLGWTRWNGDNISKKKLFSQLVSAVAVLQGYIEFVI